MSYSAESANCSSTAASSAPSFSICCSSLAICLRSGWVCVRNSASRRFDPCALARCCRRSLFRCVLLAFLALQVDKPLLVVVEIALERLDLAVVHQVQIVGGGAQQVTVVRDHHQRAFEIDQRLGQRLTHVEIQVVGRFIEQQQVRALPDDQRQHQPRLLAAGETFGHFADLVALEAETAQIVAQLLLQHPWCDAAQVLQRRFVGTQEFQLVLGEVTQLDAFRQAYLAAQRCQGAGQQFDQRRFTGAVAAEQANARAGHQVQLD